MKFRIIKRKNDLFYIQKRVFFIWFNVDKEMGITFETYDQEMYISYQNAQKAVDIFIETENNIAKSYNETARLYKVDKKFKPIVIEAKLNKN